MGPAVALSGSLERAVASRIGGMRRSVLGVALLALACEGPALATDAGADAGVGAADGGPPRVDLCDPALDAVPFPEPDAWGPHRGPGAPAVSFAADALFTSCAYLDGGDGDTSDHHNLVTMFDGYLLMPWAPEWGGGGLTFFDVSDPCAPVVAGSGRSDTMRETHAIGFSTLGGRWAVVDQLGAILREGGGGVQFWDVSDPGAPAAVADLPFPEVVYPDAYARITLSAFWQVPYVYAGSADLGVHIADAADPRRPRYVGNYRFDPILRVGQVQAIGNLLIATAAEGARTVLLDISDPEHPQPIAGGDFLAEDAAGTPREAYFSNFTGGFIYYARKDGGGGVIVYDVRDPSRPVHAGQIESDGNGGYVFLHEGLAFSGESSFAAVYDVRDPAAITEVARLDLEGDLDTATPIGNVVVLSVDDEAVADQGSAIAPWAAEPDARGPEVAWTWPNDGATGLRTSSRVGIAFDEAVDALSAFEGSVRLSRADGGRVAAVISAQDTVVNVHPRCPLEPDTEYVVEVMAGGVVDFNGNPVASTTRITFRTGPE